MKALGIIAAAVLTTLLNGWVLCRLWLWFIAATFHVSPLSIPQAIGVAIVLGAMHPQTSQSDSALRDRYPPSADLARHRVHRPSLPLRGAHIYVRL